MDMITPRTTTTATLSSARSSFVSAAVSVAEVAVSDGMAASLAKVETAPPLSATLARMSAVDSDRSQARPRLRRDAERNRERILAAAAGAFAGGWRGPGLGRDGRPGG